MITLTEFTKSMGEEILGIYPPQYGGIGNYPPLANQTGPDQVYVRPRQVRVFVEDYQI